jgi:RNA-directed DNA polymerase
LWALDADLSAAFDRIDHAHLLSALGTFPARDQVGKWLKAGVIEAGKGFAPTEEGTPQGGVISPLLLNVALHGLEEAAGVRYYTSPSRAGEITPGSPVLVRYADDLVVLCHSQDQAEQAKVRLAGWLAPRGLAFNEDKTRIVHLAEGFDFLGFTVRRYGAKLLIKPSKAAIRRVRKRLATEVVALRGANAPAVLATLVPIVRGWASYYRGVVSSKTFSALDTYLWGLLYKWAKHTHPNKPKDWIVKRYFGAFHKSRKDRWVFGDRDSGAYLPKFAWTKIVRHQMVAGTASPDDPALADYWAYRRRRNQPPLDRSTLWLLRRQHGRCGFCGDYLLHADREPADPQQWESWHRTVRKAITRHHLVVHGRTGTSGETRLVHAQCHYRATGADMGTALLQTGIAQGLA